MASRRRDSGGIGRGNRRVLIAGATLFGADIERHTREVAEILEIINLRPQELRGLMTLHSWIPTPHNLKWKRALKRLDRIVHDVIAARRSAGSGGGDILDRLLQARDEETGEGLDETQIRDEVVTLMLAGHDTSACALTWTLYLLATHPEVESRLVDQVEGVRVPAEGRGESACRIGRRHDPCGGRLWLHGRGRDDSPAPNQSFPSRAAARSTAASRSP